MHAKRFDADPERPKHPTEFRLVREARVEEGLGLGQSADVWGRLFRRGSARSSCARTPRWSRQGRCQDDVRPERGGNRRQGRVDVHLCGGTSTPCTGTAWSRALRSHGRRPTCRGRFARCTCGHPTGTSSESAGDWRTRSRPRQCAVTLTPPRASLMGTWSEGDRPGPGKLSISASNGGRTWVMVRRRRGPEQPRNGQRGIRRLQTLAQVRNTRLAMMHFRSQCLAALGDTVDLRLPGKYSWKRGV